MFGAPLFQHHRIIVVNSCIYLSYLSTVGMYELIRATLFQYRSRLAAV